MIHGQNRHIIIDRFIRVFLNSGIGVLAVAHVYNSYTIRTTVNELLLN